MAAAETWWLRILLYSSCVCIISALFEFPTHEISNAMLGIRGKRSIIKKSSLIGGALQMVCEKPVLPRRGSLQCRTSTRKTTCTATCLDGYVFPDGTTVKKHECSNYDGIWQPTSRFEDCSAICNPSCENGGRCLEANYCMCTPKFRGPRCEYPLDNCHAGKLGFVGNWACNHTSEETFCTITCPSGMKFEHLPEAVYKCDLKGQWTPPSAPKCIFENVYLHPESIITGGAPQVAYTSISSAIKESATCYVWGHHHFRTFDGAVYSFEGKCTYLLVKDAEFSSFAVHIKSDPECTGPSSCNRQIFIYIDKIVYVIKKVENKIKVYTDETEIKVPSVNGGLLLEKIANSLLVDSGLGFKLRWDGEIITIEASSDMRNKTAGLCGFYNGNPADDFRQANGKITYAESFVNSWRMNDFEENCPDAQKLENRCAYNNVFSKYKSDKADQACKFNTPAYAQCSEIVDRDAYLDACKFDYCTCKYDSYECICNTAAAYFKECRKLGGRIPGGWRSSEFCPMECPDSMVYSECGSSCQKTCKNTVFDCANDDCVDGCHCPPGTVLHEDRCVIPEECPCYHGGKVYKNGQKIRQDCNACECRGAKWQCTQEQCDSRCFAIGDPHYQTFDGRHYDFMGQCSYYLMYHQNYSIEQENVACSGAVSESLGFLRAGNGLPSCTKSITIRIRGTVLRLQQGQEASINGKDLGQLPASAPGVFVYIASSMFLKVDLENGLTVTWDGESRVYIDAPPSFMSRTQGLCGTFTNNQKDDFLTGEGDIEQDVNAFANKWKTQDSCIDLEAGQTLRDPCELYSQHKATSERHCGQLKSSIFKECHDIVDVEPYYKDCMYDTCYCESKIKNCLCPALSNYATECSKKGTYIDWRANVRECGMNCLGGQVYHVCSSSCTRSCADISHHTSCKENCVEGCNCPKGMTLNNAGDCIPIAACPCIFEEKEYIAGYKTMREGKMCECLNAVWECRIATGEELSLEQTSDKETKNCSAAANMEYVDCSSECPTTCRNMHSPQRCGDTICKPGCACKKGYVLDTKSTRCVKPTQCPCHHGGRSYNEFDMMQEDCNTCVCEGGAWKCEKNECPGNCLSWGDSHFRTFDGRIYEFHGDCDYILVKGGEDKYSSFAVTIHNVVCGTSDVTCSKSVNLAIGDEKVTLSSEKRYPKQDVGARFIIRQVGLYVFVHTDIGITLQWDKGTSVQIRANNKWKDRLEGLCGNFNGNELDDFRTSDGGPPVVRATVFGDSWRVQDYCPKSKAINNTCDLHPHRRSWAIRQCSVLKSEVFKRCHTEVSYEPFIERCIFDTCACDIGGDCNCLCTALATYAQECNLNGVPIHWRSQELCPIQCEECSKYSPCMSVCPPKTCETQYLYASLEETCGSETCVEGCEPKPCGADEIFNNDSEFKCIPKSSCVIQPCRLFNGKMYHEGERVDDSSVGDKCQSCYCRKGDFVCSGKPCQPERLPSTPPTPVTFTTPNAQLPVCDKTNWTDWMSAFTPTYKNGGDYETFEMLRKRLFTFCPLEFMKSIECRTVGTHEHYKNTGQNVWCSLPEGLICENRDQAGTKLCYDYEIRIFCQCAPEEESTTIQTVSTTQALLPIIQCNSGWTNWMNSKKPDKDGDAELLPHLRKQYTFCNDEDIDFVECKKVDGTIKQSVECSKDIGLVCRNTQNQTCDDHEIRFYCSCEKPVCEAAMGMETGAILDRSIAVSSFRSFNTLGSKARLNADGAWSPSTPWHQWIQIKLPEVQEVSGVSTQGNPNAPEWVTYYEVQYSDDGNNWEFVLTPESTTLLMTGNVDESTIATSIFPTPVKARYIRITPVKWVQWPSLRLELLGCNRNLPTTQTTVATSATPSIFPPTCKQGYTEWMNIDSPDQLHTYEKGTLPHIKPGDNELASELHYFYEFCAKPTAAQCRNAATGLSAHLTSQIVTCDSDGLKCNNDDQVGGYCQDYEIRFFCQCEEVTTEITTASPSTNPPAACDDDQHGWTQWMNSNHPEDNPEGDMESLSSLRRHYTFCGDDYVKDIQCRTAGTKLPFETVGQYGVVCDVNHGLQCIHSSQLQGVCKDYEVRVFCLCVTTTVTTEANTIETSTTSEKQICDKWTSWFNRDSPQDDGNDDELIRAIPNFDKICTKAVNVQCRDAQSKQKHSSTGQHFREPCTTNGLSCESIGQNCRDYEIRAFCTCPTAPTTPSPSCVSGWTEWFDTHDPNNDEGDFEQIEEIRKQYDFCDTDYITTIECKSKRYSVGLKKGSNRGGTKSGNSAASKTSTSVGEYEDLVDYTKTGDVGVKCSTTHGLACYNQMQSNKRICRNYRVRFYCSCGGIDNKGEVDELKTSSTTLTTEKISKDCGWTPWLNADRPTDKSTGDGDYETIPKLQATHGICDRSEIAKIECRLADARTPWNTAGQLNISCDTEHGFQCNNKLQIGECYDYEVRFECLYDWCPTTTMIPQTASPAIITSTPPCPPGVQWSDCASNCSRMCHSFLKDSQSIGLCGSQNPSKCIPGCVFEECAAEEFQRDQKSCVRDSECTCITDNGITLAPGEMFSIDNCTLCQCVSNAIHCTVTCFEPNTIVPKGENIVRENCWTEWINVDSPNDQKDLGDLEEIRAIRTKFEICAQPTVIECRVANSNISLESAGQKVECDLRKGLVCWNSHNLPDGCSDYEIRLYCSDCNRATTTTFTQTTTTESTTATYPTTEISKCIPGFTEWMSSDKPDYSGENENIPSLRAAGNIFCPTDKITAIECRTVSYKVPHFSSKDVGVVCEIYEGLQCDSKRQPKGRTCNDYEVRFYCDCGFPEATTIVATEPTIPAPTTGFTSGLPPCDYWSNWINNDNPIVGIGDVELLPISSRACKYGFITHVECIEAEFGRPYNSTGDQDLVCDLRKGFSCLNRKQPNRKCSDYKIRYFCSCTELTSTEATTTEATTITTTIGITKFKPDETAHCTRFIKGYMSRLSDTAFRASSSRDIQHGPNKGNILSDGAWSPAEQTNQQYIELDIYRPQLIFGIVTKGHPTENSWVLKYQVMFSNDGKMYSYHQHDDIVSVFPGNIDGDTPAYRVFPKPVQTRYIRIIPQEWQGQIALRVEPMLCEEGAIEYGTSTTAASTAIYTTTASKTYKTIEPICEDFMGIQNGELSDSQIFASSYLNDDLAPYKGRLNGLTAWVALISDEYQYLQFDFIEPRALTGIVTEGRNSVSQWVTSYNVQYSNTGTIWSYILDVNLEPQVFEGNNDNIKPVTNYFEKPVRARFLRIIPKTWHNWIAMRVEIKGCYEAYSTSTKLETTEAATTESTVTTATPMAHTIVPSAPECSEPMGIASGKILPEQIHVTSSLAGERSGPKRIAIGTKEGYDTGGWVANTNSRNEYVEIAFNEMISITGLTTQGRDKYPEWVKSYKVMHSTDKYSWKYALGSDGYEVIEGNYDNGTPVTRYFLSTITAQYIRIYPYEWKDHIAMRLEILGCHVKEEKKCTKYTDWVSNTFPKLSSPDDYETVDSALNAYYHRDECITPVVIECRSLANKKPYNEIGQNVTCDLQHGLVCRKQDQKPKSVCKDYEIRVGCWICPATTSPPPPILCPEVPIEMVSSCPETCPQNFNCDGSQCVEYHNCSCFQDGRKYKPGETMETKDCHICTCAINGHSFCVNKTCDTCPEGHEADLDENCNCKCKTCPPTEKLCPTSKQCILESQWCNGETDCPDDELNCPTTEYTTSATPPPTPEPPKEASCEITGGYIRTFDGEYLYYDICNHVLFTDREHDDFNITIMKICPMESNSTKCHKSYVIKHEHLSFQIYNGQVYDTEFNVIPHEALPLIEKRFKDIAIRKAGNAIIFKSIQHNFALIIEDYGHARIDVKENLLGKVYGLCGFYNNNNTDDFQLKDGTTSLSSDEFGADWAHSNSDSCSDQKCDPKDWLKAMELCDALGKDPFDVCHKTIHLDEHIAFCAESICECFMLTNKTDKQCQCDGFVSYVEECERQRGLEIPYWRSRTGCHSPCPPNLVWKDCGPNCEPTCEDIKQTNQSDSCDQKKCVAGCFCPDGLIRKGDKCVEATKCCDCVCKGYGDPHYYSFDGKYFPFQGNCTYVLARPKSPQQNYSFEVYATNEDCFEEPLTTCTVAVMVLYKDHFAYFRINESVTFDGVQLYPHHFPFEAYGIHIESIPGRSVTFTVPEEFLEVRYFELNYGFEVRLPSEIYYNQTEGLCGNCNHDPDDDIKIKDGVVTNNTDDFGFSWLAKPPEGMESTNDVCKVKLESQCRPGAELEIHRCQDIIKNSQFAACTYIIDPEPLIKACEFDVCHSENPIHSVCRTLTEYARRCATAGICIQDWRSPDFCDYQCPDGMYFDQCGPACPTYCVHIVNATQKPDYCDIAPVDGCFCKGGKVFNEDGMCVDPRECETCDEEGHKIGETWYPDPCTTCKCTTNKKVECLKQTCSEKPICRPKEFLQTNYASNETCCNKYTCVPEPVKPCPPVEMPQCEMSQALKQIVSGDQECPTYICECDPFLCPPLRFIELEVGEEVQIQQEGCCNVSQSICNTNKCPKGPKCPKGYTLHEKEYSKYKCCQEFECLPPPNACLYYHEFEVVNGNEVRSNQISTQPTMYQYGDTWTDGLCKTCACEGKKGFHCTSEICPTLDQNGDINEYVLATEHFANECCPKIIRVMCKYEDANYTIGTKWNSLTDKCKSYSCEESTDGIVHKTEMSIQCSTDCPVGSKYVEPSENSTDCCGKCQITSCVENEVIYEIGQTWNSSIRLCYSAECEKPEDQIQVLYTKLPCPQLPQNCIQTIPDETGCCEICNATEVPPPHLLQEPCAKKKMPAEETIGLFELFTSNTRCSNKYPINDLMSCSGGCESHSIYSSVQHDFASICKCCTPIKTEKKMIYLDCHDGIQRPIDYYQPTLCDCTICGKNEKPEKIVLPEARQK